MVRVLEDEIAKPVLADSVPLVQGDQVWDAGYDFLLYTAHGVAVCRCCLP